MTRGARIRSATAALLTLLGAGLHGQTPSFRATVDAVQVDVLATRDGRLLTGLQAGDFELRDSGVLQHVEVLTYADLPVNLLLALDTSSSLSGEPLEHLKQAARAAVETLRPEDRVALLTFSHEVSLRVPWGTDRELVSRAIDGVQAEGATALHDAAFVAMALGGQTEGRVLVLLFSDGMDTASWLGPLRVVEQAQRSDVIMSAVQLESMQDLVGRIGNARGPRPLPASALRRGFLEEPSLFRQQFLSAITDETGGDLLTTSNTDQLRSAFLALITRFKTRYLLTYSPKDVPDSGWHPIEVRLKERGEVKARRGYLR